MPNSASTEVFGINIDGAIVGDYSTSSGVLRGFLLSHGTYTDIVHPNSNFIIATGINDNGIISGYFADASDYSHGFTYSSGIFTPIDYPGATSTQAMSINNTDIVVGYYWDASGESHGFTFDRGHYTRINGPKAIRTAVLGINNSNVIVGYYLDASFFMHGFEKEPGKPLRTIDYAPNTQTEIAGINDLGRMTGYYAANNTDLGFLLKDGKFSTFTYPGAAATMPNAIKRSGVIVGTFTDSTNQAHGFARD
ncbi:MAG TPA: hypothetical protein VIW68_10870 [Candidatus Sulfotelmatobacter sp.]